jgi:hypothetical protein
VAMYDEHKHQHIYIYIYISFIYSLIVSNSSDTQQDAENKENNLNERDEPNRVAEGSTPSCDFC